MGSLGEDELVQMVRDYMESESSTPVSQITSKLPPDDKHETGLQDILLEATAYETQVLDKVMMYVRNMGEPSCLKKWVVMRLQMDGYEASLCRSSWVSTFGNKVLQFSDCYEYIQVLMVDKNSYGSKPTRLIVDMDFRSQFELARPTQTYRELVNMLPSIFVGAEERLEKIISVLCSAAKQSLNEKGLHIPPWRKANYMHSKWLSKNCKKVPVWANPEIMGEDDSAQKGTKTCCPSIL